MMRRAYVVTATLTSAMAIWLIFFAFDRNPALDYGGPGDVYIRPPEVVSAQDANVCFKKTAWLRLCPSLLIEHIQIDGIRFDLAEPHHIRPPQMIGTLAPKCRALKIPPIPLDFRGDAIYTAELESYCGIFGHWFPIKNKITGVHFTVKSSP